MIFREQNLNQYVNVGPTVFKSGLIRSRMELGCKWSQKVKTLWAQNVKLK